MFTIPVARGFGSLHLVWVEQIQVASLIPCLDVHLLLVGPRIGNSKKINSFKNNQNIKLFEYLETLALLFSTDNEPQSYVTRCTVEQGSNEDRLLTWRNHGRRAVQFNLVNTSDRICCPSEQSERKACLLHFGALCLSHWERENSGWILMRLFCNRFSVKSGLEENYKVSENKTSEFAPVFGKQALTPRGPHMDPVSRSCTPSV